MGIIEAADAAKVAAMASGNASAGLSFGADKTAVTAAVRAPLCFPRCVSPLELLKLITWSFVPFVGTDSDGRGTGERQRLQGRQVAGHHLVHIHMPLHLLIRGERGLLGCLLAYHTRGYLYSLNNNRFTEVGKSNLHADMLLVHFYRWMRSPQAKLYDPALHRLVHGMMRKVWESAAIA